MRQSLMIHEKKKKLKSQRDSLSMSENDKMQAREVEGNQSSPSEK